MQRRQVPDDVAPHIREQLLKTPAMFAVKSALEVEHVRVATEANPDPFGFLWRHELAMTTDYSFTIERMKGFIKPKCGLTDARIPVAKNINEAMRSKYRDDYISGCMSSLVGHLENLTFLPVLRSSLPPGTKVYDNMWAMRYKQDVTLPI